MNSVKNTKLDEDLLIINMDKVPMVFDKVSGSTIHCKGKKDLEVSTIGGKKTHFTVFLAMNAAGDFLPTFTIYLRGRQPLRI